MRDLIKYEGTVENGEFALSAKDDTPEQTLVDVLLPDLNPQQTYKVMSPRLVHPERTKDFVKEAIEETPDAS